MAKIKVFGGLTMIKGSQVRTIIATTSKKRGAEMVGISLNEFSNYWCVTGNKKEIECAMNNVGKVLRASTSMGYDFS